MAKKTTLTILSFSILIISLLIFSLPRNVQANNEGKRYVGTTCQTADASWRCNNCTSGTTTCADNACADCMPPQQ